MILHVNAHSRSAFFAAANYNSRVAVFFANGKKIRATMHDGSSETGRNEISCRYPPPPSTSVSVARCFSNRVESDPLFAGSGFVRPRLSYRFTIYSLSHYRYRFMTTTSTRVSRRVNIERQYFINARDERHRRGRARARSRYLFVLNRTREKRRIYSRRWNAASISRRYYFYVSTDSRRLSLPTTSTDRARLNSLRV